MVKQNAISQYFSIKKNISKYIRMKQSTPSFKDSVTFQDRKEESLRIKEKYPDRIPCIVELSYKKKTDLPDFKKKKFLVPADLTCGQLIYVIRKQIKLSAEKGIFVYVKDTILPPTSSLVSQIYAEHKDDDGFLYFKVSSENTFGQYCVKD